jgi:putative cofactor-binding repeat protein
MKKILVVLLVLAVATGVFAQEGEWSFDGTAEIGAYIDFDPDASVDGIKATSGPVHYNRLYDGFDGIKGKLGINYNRDIFGAGLTIQSINNWADPMLIGTVNAAGENYNFNVESNVNAILDGSPGFRQLWGNYTFLNGVFFLETSYSRGWAGDAYWVSNKVGAFRNWNGRANAVIAGPFVDLHTFTMLDNNGDAGAFTGDSSSSYIVGNVQLQGLSFGLMVRDIFRGSKQYFLDDPDARGFTDVLSRDDFDELWGYANADDATKEVIDDLWDTFGVTLPMTFVDDVLKKMIFGVKFEMSPIEVAAQFLMEDYGVYVGGKWMLGPVTVGLSFMGILNEKYVSQVNPVTYEKKYEATEQTHMKVGGGVDYEADSFSAWIKAFYAIEGNANKADYIQGTEIGVEPGFSYNVIPSHLQFKLDTGFYFFGYKSNGEKVTKFGGMDLSTVQYALQPQLFWNFLGTGAGGYGGTGIALRYRLVGGDADKFNPIGMNNKFDVQFKYSF